MLAVAARVVSVATSQPLSGVYSWFVVLAAIALAIAATWVLIALAAQQDLAELASDHQSP